MEALQNKFGFSTELFLRVFQRNKQGLKFGTDTDTDDPWIKLNTG